MPTTTSTTLAIVLAAAGAAASAADTAAINDLRLEAGRSPYTYQVDNGGDFSTRSWRFGAQYVRSIGALSDVGGFIAGLEVSDTDANGKRSIDSDVNTVAVDLMAGWAYALPNDWRALHLEAAPYVGVGRSTIKNSAASLDESATYVEWGIRAAALWTFANHWQVGADVRYVSGSFKPSIGGTDVKIEDKGAVGMLLVGYRF